MNLSARNRKNIKTIGAITLTGMIIGLIFSNIVFGSTFSRMIRGAAIGFLITLISSSTEVFFFQRSLKQLSFSATLFARTAFYIIVISISTSFVILLHESIETNTSIITTLFESYMQEFFTKDFVTILVFSVLASFSINLFWQLNRILGKGVLLNLLIGKYSRPRSEERIFMFLDLNSATTIAEQLGLYKYSSLIQSVFSDVTGPILETKAEVYQYIGDEIVLTWKLAKGIKNNNCIELFFRIKEKIKSKERIYFRKYGVTPSFKAGLHCGEAIVTEVGDVKKGIVYHGDVLNTTARIREQCGELYKEFLVSDDLLQQLDFKNFYQVEKMGTFKLRGKENEIELYSVLKNS
ncbi:MAG: adenylate/guanylate cyclase domain-containing protein [Ignavibacteriaceae bacterium]